MYYQEGHLEHATNYRQLNMNYPQPKGNYCSCESPRAANSTARHLYVNPCDVIPGERLLFSFSGIGLRLLWIETDVQGMRNEPCDQHTFTPGTGPSDSHSAGGLGKLTVTWLILFIWLTGHCLGLAVLLLLHSIMYNCGALKNSGLLRNAVKLTHRSGAARYAASGTLQSNESNRGHWLVTWPFGETKRTVSS